MPSLPESLTFRSILGLTAEAITAAKRAFHEAWRAWLGANPTFRFPDWSAEAVAAKQSGGRALVEAGRFAPGGEGRFQPSWGPGGGRPNRCCRFGTNCGTTGCQSRPHWGIDVLASIGTPVYAAKDGLVLRAGTRSGYGNVVEISHPDGPYSTVYAHLSRMLVSTGDSVTAGQHIGDAGISGMTAVGEGNSHLHFEVHRGAATNFTAGRHRLDPASWLDEQGIRPANRAPLMLAFRTPEDDWTGAASSMAGFGDAPQAQGDVAGLLLALGLGAAVGYALVQLNADPMDDEV